jgi:hypothetical protein
MFKRKALLIGVPKYDAQYIKDLPVVINDLNFLRKSLESSEYLVESQGIGDSFGLSRTRIVRAIRDFCDKADSGTTLIIYYSGHGIHHEGVDYLIPPDAFLDDPSMLSEYLIPLDFADSLGKSKAQTILFFIDACREGVELIGDSATKNIKLGAWSSGKRAITKQRESAYVFSCDAGEYSRFQLGESEEDKFSLFTRALADVLDCKHPAQTFSEVRKALQEELDKLTGKHDKPKQTIKIRGEFDAQDTLNNRIICSGYSSPIDELPHLALWCKSAENSILWDLSEPAESRFKGETKQHVVEIVSIAQSDWELTTQDLHDDPWLDIDFPIRVLARLEFLCKESSETLKLSLAEIALLISVPFIHMGIRAIGLRKAFSANAYSLETTGTASGVRGSLERYYRSIPDLISRVERLRNDDPITANYIATWIIHRWLLREPEVWSFHPNGYIDAELWNKLTVKSNNQFLNQTFDDDRVLELVYCIHADSQRIERSDRRNALKVRLTIMGGTVHEQLIREKVLAYLIALASRMAIDVSTLSRVLIDHVGTSDTISPRSLLQTVVTSTWDPIAQHRTLKAICDHPAIDYALRLHVDEAERLLKAIQVKTYNHQDDLHLLSGLPSRLTADEVKPCLQDGHLAYQLPHLRFRLDHQKIRDLLMGEKIYGDPTLAIRELYQNALDACRYREARLEYLCREGHEISPWSGQIVFRQGKDSEGRAYIECEDNGIGMGHLEITECFARAGQRFAETSEFLEEQGDWLRCSEPVRLYPNSQFGVGVFSYFMLADEIHLETCRLDRFGNPTEGLKAVISSRGSLFRVHPSGSRKKAGTTIRLYLKQIEELDKVSCIETLSKLLIIADYETSIVMEEDNVHWQPKQLKLSEEQQKKYSVQETDNPNLWWTSVKDGQILSDGIMTDSTIDFAVVNLCHQFRPELTVDRLKIREYDKSYVQRLLADNVTALSCCPIWLDYEWLWQFIQVNPSLGDRLVFEMSSKKLDLPISHKEKDVKKIRAKRVKVLVGGCISEDRYVIDCIQKSQCSVDALPLPLMALRCAILRQAGLEEDYKIESSNPIELFPLLSASEWVEEVSVVLSKKLNGHSPWIDSIMRSQHILLAAAKLAKPPSYILEVLERYTQLLNLDFSQVERSSLSKVIPDEIDRILILRELNTYWKARRQKRNHNYFTLHDFLCTASRLQISLSNLLERINRYAAVLGINLDLLSFNELPCESTEKSDIILVSQSLDGKLPWINGQITIPQILGMASRIGRNHSYVVTRLKLYSLILGFDLSLLEDVQFPENIGDSTDAIVLSRRLNGQTPWLEGNVSIGHVLRAAAKLNRPAKTILEQIQPYVSILQLNLPLIDSEELSSSSPNKIDQFLLSLGLNSSHPWLSGTISLAHLIGAASQLNMNIIVVFQRLQLYAEAVGFYLPSEALVRSLSGYQQGDATLLSCNLNQRHPWVKGTISVSQLIKASVILKQSILKILERFQYYQNFIEINLPTINLDISLSYIPNECDLALLTENKNGKIIWLQQISGEHILSTAAAHKLSVSDVYAHLKHYEQHLDLKIPSLDSSKLPAQLVNREDSVILSNRLNESKPWVQKVSSMHILHAALELDISPFAVFNRLQSYQSLLNLELSPFDCENFSLHLIDRRDRVLLSQDLDEQKPWVLEVSGRDIFMASLKLCLSPISILRTYQDYVQVFALKICDQLDSTIIPDSPVEKIDCDIFEEIFKAMSRGKNTNFYISLGCILATSHRINRPIAFVVEQLQKYKGLLMFEMASLDTSRLEEFIPEELDCILFSENLNASQPWLDFAVSDQHIRSASWITGKPIQDLRDRVQMFETLS